MLASNNSLKIKLAHDPVLTQQLEVQENSIQHLMSLVEDILDYSKIQFGKFELNNTWFSVHDVISEALAMCKFQTIGKDVKLVSQIGILENIEVLSDRKRLKQILINLISNSLKFTYHGSVTVKVSFDELQQLMDDEQFKDCSNALITDHSILPTITSRNDIPKGLQFEIIDTGIGMSREDKDQLF